MHIYYIYIAIYPKFYSHSYQDSKLAALSKHLRTATDYS